MAGYVTVYRLPVNSNYKTEQSQGIISGKLNLCDVQVYSEQAIFINVLQIIWSTFFCENIQK